MGEEVLGCQVSSLSTPILYDAEADPPATAGLVRSTTRESLAFTAVSLYNLNLLLE